MTLFEELQWRGLIQDISSADLEHKLNHEKLTFYIGTDPTADSLHLGHYSSFLITKRLANAGHTPIMLVGGSTALVGDPRGTTERKLASKTEVDANFEKLKTQLQSLFPYEVVNNYDWTKDMLLLDFLRDYGKVINVSYMLAKDLVSRQLATGLSYAEFSYMLLQAYDYVHLFKNKGVTLQVAGSDQWGNITCGIEMVRKLMQSEVFAFTMPLITDSRGTKFGKSEGNSVWLDKNKTSPYALYQYFLNAEDEMVIAYLKRLTFLTVSQIEKIEEEQTQSPHLRIAQKALAKEVVTDLHGSEEYEKAVLISENLFGGNIKDMDITDILEGLKDVPNFQTAPDTLLNVLVAGRICSSKREAREMLQNGAISVNGDIEKDENKRIDSSLSLDKNIVVIRKGKKKYFVVQLI